MAVFPIFVDIDSKKCIVVGGGKTAERKIKTLIEFGASITVISPHVTDEIEKLKLSREVVHLKKCYEAQDLEKEVHGATLVIAATSDKAVNQSVADEADRHGVLVNVVDDQDRCTFVFPSIVKKSDVVIGITTSGIFPALSKSIRKRITKMLNNIDDDTMRQLGSSRQRAIIEIDDDEKRKEFLTRIAEEVMSDNEKID